MEWSFLRSPDALSFIEKRLAEHDEALGCPYRRANLAWRLMPGTPRSKKDDDLAHDAKKSGLAPAEFPTDISLEAAAAIVQQHYRAWKDAPLFGSTSPSKT